MGGKFVFRLQSKLHFNLERYRTAIREIKKLEKPPHEVYASFGPEDLGIAMVIKVQHKQDWTLILPTDPTAREIECGFTYGIVSRRDVWHYVKTILSHICTAVPMAFLFEYEDHDMGDVVEVGRYDNQAMAFVVQHRGLPSAAEMEVQATGSKTPPAGFRAKSMPVRF